MPLPLRIVLGITVMTEKQWLNGPWLEPMLDHICRHGIASDRKLRLFACACCRRVWNLLDELSRQVVEGAERHADGLLGDGDLARLSAAASAARAARVMRAVPRSRAENAVNDAQMAAEASCTLFATSEMTAGQYAAQGALWAGRTRRGEKKAKRALLHDIFGNPFRPAHVQPAWRAWHGRTLVRMARAIYDERRFGDLPILADALEEAGCAEQAILAHCRCGGEHARGCWVVDQLLGKE
jgi:hypothetical protein